MQRPLPLCSRSSGPFASANSKSWPHLPPCLAENALRAVASSRCSKPLCENAFALDRPGDTELDHAAKDRV
jgi:hypothetical protein